jgi:hypothetical protein
MIVESITSNLIIALLSALLLHSAALSLLQYMIYLTESYSNSIHLKIIGGEPKL